MYDCLIIGAVFAYEMTKRCKKCVVMNMRPQGFARDVRSVGNK